MNQSRRFVAGAAIAGALAAPPAASAGSTSPPDTTLPLPDGVAQCLIQNGFPIPSATPKLDLPPATGALPPGLTGAIPLPTGTGTSSTSTIPLTSLGLPNATGTATPLPTGGGATSGGAVQCGQVIINNTIYMILVTVTVTTTTTTANGPQVAANGPVNVTGNAPAAAPVTTTTPVVAPKKPKRRRTRRKRSTTRKHSTQRRARARRSNGNLTLHVTLLKKSPRAGSHRAVAHADRAGRGS
jgi:hypothetical protein